MKSNMTETQREGNPTVWKNKGTEMQREGKTKMMNCNVIAKQTNIKVKR